MKGKIKSLTPQLFLFAILAVVVSLFFFSSKLIFADEKDASASQSKAEYVGKDMCLGCHSDYGKVYDLTIHSKVHKDGKGDLMDCESCHGPGSEHANAGGGEAGIINPGKLSGHKASSVCLKCHQDKPGLYAFRFSKHSSAEVSCQDCHRAHGKEKKDVTAHLLRSDKEEKVCYDCHANVKAESMMPSHHPIVEGRVSCSDCHNPHGTELSAFKGAPTERELCLSCHAQYRGPFANEHQPASDSCTNCHRPHGSAENNLLSTSEPFLCLRCHPAVHNPHLPANSLSSTDLRNEVLFFSRCSVCHKNSHGSGQSDTLTR